MPSGLRRCIGERKYKKNRKDPRFTSRPGQSLKKIFYIQKVTYRLVLRCVRNKTKHDHSGIPGPRIQTRPLLNAPGLIVKK